MALHPQELPIPSAASRDNRAIELARIWAAGGKQHVSLATGIWDDPAAWGIMLVDLAKHVANAYAQTTGAMESETLQRIKEGFDAEWNTATDRPTGQVEE
jgi:hypothetical protein